MSKFVAEPSDFGDPAAPLPPQTMADLLHLLGVAESPARTRGAAVRKWLAANTPSPLLRADLVDAGYLPAARRTAARRGRQAAAGTHRQKAG